MGKPMASIALFKSTDDASFEGLARIDAMWMREAAKCLAKVDALDGDEFSKWLAVVSPRLGTMEELAHKFGVSPATYGRWVSGTNLPQKYSRQPVIDRLAVLLVERAARLDSAKD